MVLVLKGLGVRTWNPMSHTCFSRKRVPALRWRRISLHRSPRSQNSIMIHIFVVSLLMTLHSVSTVMLLPPPRGSSAGQRTCRSI